MQDIITPTPYQSSVLESPKKHKTMIFVIGMLLVLVGIVILINKLGQKADMSRSTFEQLEKVSAPVTLSKEDQVQQMENLKKSGTTEVLPASRRMDMLNQLQ